MKKIINALTCVMVLAILIIPINVNADSFRLVATPDKTSLKAGDTVTIEMGVANIDAGDLGINTIEGTLVYDESIFEEVTQSNVTSLNNWSLTYNSENTSQKGKMLGVILQSGVKTDQSFGKVTLKVKSDFTSYKETTITIKNITTNNGTDLLTDTDKTISLKVGTKATSDTVQTTKTTSDTTSGGSETTNKTSTTSSSTSTKADSTAVKSTLPQTGEEGYIIITTLGTLASLGVIGMIGMKKYKDII